MIATHRNENETTPVETAFAELMALIKLAQAAEQANEDHELRFGKASAAVCTTTMSLWDEAFDRCKDLIEMTASRRSDEHFIALADLIDDLFMTESSHRNEISDRALEQRARISAEANELEPLIIAALQFLMWPGVVPDDYADKPWPGCAP